MRNDNQAANLFATFGLGQGNATANTRIARLALDLADALSSVRAGLERSIARPPISRVVPRPRVSDVVVKRAWIAVKMRGLHAHLPRVAGDGLRQWLYGCRVSPVMCSVS